MEENANQWGQIPVDQKENLYVCMQVRRVENKNNVYKQIEFLGVKGSER